MFLEGLYCTTLPVGKWLKWKQAVDNSQAFRALLTDLSKASDTFPQEVLNAELNTHEFRMRPSKFSLE